jgi:pimeloyl-ACP methyl ester carboxylesterase
MDRQLPSETLDAAVSIAVGRRALDGNLNLPHGATGIVMFAHGSGSSRHSPRNRYVASVLREGSLATLLLDLLTQEEEAVDLRTGHLRFDIGLLADRLVLATDWLASDTRTRDLPVGLFGASTGAGAALVAAAQRPEQIRAVVSRGGRPDLAHASLALVKAPTLLIVGGNDEVVIELNQEALGQLRVTKELRIIPGASHLFEEPGTLEQVADLARAWFQRHLSVLVPAARRRRPPDVASPRSAVRSAAQASRSSRLVIARLWTVEADDLAIGVP